MGTAREPLHQGQGKGESPEEEEEQRERAALHIIRALLHILRHPPTHPPHPPQAHHDLLRYESSKIHNGALAASVACGVGCHNAGLDGDDRAVVEALFLQVGTTVGRVRVERKKKKKKKGEGE